VQQVRFATPLTGYAYDPSLLVTTDGGLRWHRLRGAYVSSLETAGGTVVRVASAGTGCSGMRYQVDAAAVGSTAWRALPAPPILQICPPVLYRQGERLVLAGYGNPAGGVRATAQIARSADGGQAWASGPDHCGGTDGYASTVALAPPDVLVLLCQHQMPGATGAFGPAWVRVSANGGASFGPGQIVPSRPAAAPGTILRYQLAAASAGRLLVVETSQVGPAEPDRRRGGRPRRLPGSGHRPDRPGRHGVDDHRWRPDLDRRPVLRPASPDYRAVHQRQYPPRRCSSSG
jgi:hypothetical protein